MKKKIKPEYQDEISECGLTCLSMILNFYGYSTSVAQLRVKHQASSQGVSLYQLMKMAEEYALICRPFSLTIDDLDTLELPAILFWNKSHYVVLEKVKKSGIVIVDPALGRRYYKFSDARSYFSNVAMEMSCADEFSTKETHHEDGFSFFSILKKNNSLSFRVLVFLIPLFIGLVIQLISPKLFSITVDDVIQKNDSDLLIILLYMYSVCYIVNFMVQIVGGKISMHLRVAITHKVTASVVRHLLHLPLSFFERRNIAQLIRKVNAGNYVHLYFIDGYPTIVIELLFSLLLLLLMFMANAELAVMIINISIIYFIIRFYIISRQERIQNEIITADIKKDNVLISAIDNIRSIKFNNAEAAKIADWTNKQAESEYLKAKLSFFDKISQTVHLFTSNIHTIIICWYGSTSIFDGSNSLGELFSFVLYKDMFMNTIILNTERFAKMKIYSVEISKMNDIVNHKSESCNENPYLDVKCPENPLINTIQLNSVYFRYGEFDDYILKNISMNIARGEKHVIYGPSGCGKSTLMKVLSGLYHPVAGSLLVNGINISNYGVKSFRRKVSYVSGGEEILNNSIMNNIIYDEIKDKVDFSLISESVRLAGLEFVVENMPNGLNTVIGPGGVALSSGQKQRLLIARALYKRPNFLFLDEPTSHLDNISKNEMISVINNLSISCVIITHDKEFRKITAKNYYMSNACLHEDK
ncbi:peptidase domain-containing ABC transporter [Salmonella enterica subsp. enterica serovar Ball]|nr:peptidase domain-containing ABC transporter [Salmonella enterica subsp. enterica serovar Ball]